tara:strand:+ start:5472 stop:6239 length:768 start_codon:yes stop_codon:yes gene_type:complete
MDIEISNPRKVIQFAVIISNLKHILSEVTFYFTEDGLYIQGMDSSHISLAELNLNNSWFDNYKIDKPHTFGLNLASFDTIISCLDKNFKILINHKEDDYLNITLTDDKIVKQYQMVLIDIESTMLNVPNPEYSADITMKSSLYKDYINELSMFGDDLYVNCYQENVKLSSRGDYGKSEIIIKEEYLEEYLIEEDVDISQFFNIKMIKCFTNFTKLNKIVKFHLLKDSPMKIIYELSEKDPEKNSLKFYIAPKVED